MIEYMILTAAFVVWLWRSEELFRNGLRLIRKRQGWPDGK